MPDFSRRQAGHLYMPWYENILILLRLLVVLPRNLYLAAILALYKYQ
jgi:hypothetical protein